MIRLFNSMLKTLYLNKAFRIVSVYFIISLLWIFFTDDLVFKLISDAETQHLVSSIKGWFFVIATTLLLFYLIHQALLKVSTAEQKSVESEVKFRSVFENSVDAMVVSKEGKHLFFNQALITLFGYSRRELTGKPVIELIAPLRRESVQDIVLRRANGENVPSVYESAGLRKDGTIFDLDVKVSNYQLNADNYTLVIFRDISERKKAEEELKSSFEKTIELEAIINRSPAVAFLWRAEDNWPVEYVSDNVLQFGYTPEELLTGKIIFPKIIHPEDLGRIADEVNRYSKSGIDEFSQVYRIIAKSGEIRYVDDRTWIRRGAGNKITHYQGIILDITERKKAEENVKESERRFTGILESVDLVSVILDTRGGVTFCNKFFLDLTGYAEVEVLNNNWFDLFIPGEMHENLKNIFNDALSKNSFPPHYLNEIVTKKGEKKLISWNNTVLKDTEGNTIGTASIGEDITEKKRLEEELITNSRQLHALTAHLQRIREEEREFIAREMHDELGQILTSLKMNVVFLKRELEGSTTAEMKSKILDEFESINLTIDRAVSEVRKLITQLRPELLDKLGLVPALEWYAEEYSKRTSIRCEFASECGELNLSHDLELAVFRIVQEAMTNTAKHSGAKTVQIRACKKGPQFYVEITDDGSGIPESELEGNNSFGLLGMRERAHLIGGTLELSGVPGRGTTVKLSVML